jgi:hypothetical protein
MVTIHKLLFTEAHKLSSSKIMSSFQRTSCAKRPARSTRTLIFDAGDGAVIAPIEVSGKIVRRQDRCLLSIRRKLKPPLQPEKVPPEFGRSKVGELGDAVDGGGVELLVALGAAEVRLEDGESVIVLHLGGVGFGVLGLEEGEVVVGVEERVVVLWRYYLLN